MGNCFRGLWIRGEDCAELYREPPISSSNRIVPRVPLGPLLPSSSLLRRASYLPSWPQLVPLVQLRVQPLRWLTSEPRQCSLRRAPRPGLSLETLRPGSPRQLQLSSHSLLLQAGLMSAAGVRRKRTSLDFFLFSQD